MNKDAYLSQKGVVKIPPFVFVRGLANMGEAGAGVTQALCNKKPLKGLSEFYI